MKVADLGLVDFSRACAVQDRLVAELRAGSSGEVLLLLEHFPVYTIGSGGRVENILAEGIVPHRINRGGDVTWHGPGQLVGYPILDLGRRGRDLHRYLRFIEEVLIRLCGNLGVDAGRVPGLTGIWTARGKLASIGVGVRRWVTMHGFALNVSPDLGAFALINPCGMADCPVTSLEREQTQPAPIPEVKERIAVIFPQLLAELLPQESPVANVEIIPDTLMKEA
ncbi:lipoyl(octanoyl) transferase LipB [Geobacter sp. DSM 9736]|uniref:lipoyl(octanoyl) transferase LipB n=1 Tax=Geobacter sp. DSM 9736 TaxID=1277350 RepID=UPI000B5083AC|nr:lipoyl(octanoyl) transferase LipB [Geobacter sp. DSM 9736]SNB47944.1 lipoyl(octanoyl) transferase [Geobacter sp. DSM 9736]